MDPTSTDPLPAGVKRWFLAPLAALLVSSAGLAGQEPPGADSRIQGPEALRWRTLPDLPDPVGLAGPFAGTHGEVLIVAGGANFPGGMPWDGGAKGYHAAIHVFDGETWHTAAERLPAECAYGVSISTAAGLICIGGQDGSRVHREVYRLRWDAARKVAQRSDLPALPQPLANAGGALVQDAIYVAGGHHEPDGSPGSAFYRLDLSRAGQDDFAWESLPPLPGPRRGLPAVAALDGALYVISGRDYGPARQGAHPYAYHRDLLRYDPATATWDPPVPIRPDRDTPPRCVMAAAAIGFAGRVLIFGGADGTLMDRGLTLDPAAGRDFLEHHPGFSREVLAYSPTTRTFSVFARLHTPHRLPVTTTAVRYAGGIVIPTGEVSPGRRSPRVWCATTTSDAAEPERFGPLNWVTLSVYLLAMVGIGLYCSRHVKGTEEFFLAGRRIPWWAAGLSIFGTQLSAITFMAIPATTFAGDWVRFFGPITLMLVLPIVIFLYLPAFLGLRLSTAYEYLDRRFGPGARSLAASLFVLFQLGRMGIVLYLPSIALAAVTGMNVFLCIGLMGVLAILYTVLGGIEAVIWTDVAQVVVLMGGAVLALVVAVADSGGLGEVLRLGAAADKFRIAHHGYDLGSTTVPVMFAGLFVLSLIPYSSDQTVIQRYMTTADRRSAARSLWTNFWMTVPTGIVFFGLGTALYAFYLTNPEHATPVKHDEIVPWFVVHELPPGIAGLVIAAIFAASMSSLDSSMNSVSTVLICDFYRRWRPGSDDATQLRLGRVLTLLLGIAGTSTACIMASTEIKFLFDAFNKLLGLFGGALGGLFFLGIFCRRARSRHALTGTVAGAVTVGALEYLNLTSATPPVHPYLFAAFGFGVCVLVGYGASLTARTPA